MRHPSEKVNSPTHKPTISVVIPTLDQGGAERSMIQLANGLAREGFDATLVTALHADGVYRCEVTAPLVDLSAGRQRHIPRALHRYMKSASPDIVVTALINNWVLGLHAIMRYPARIVISERTFFSGFMAERGGVLSKLTTALSRFLYRNAERIVAVSHGVADDLAATGLARREQLRVIYNPVISETFEAMRKEPASQALLAVDRPNFIAVGRLSELKNYPDMFRAFALVRKKVPCRLVVLGEGESRPHLEELVDELGLRMDISMPGFVRNPFPYVERADCFVMSSKHEGLPGSLVQALACGTTVVSTDCRSGPDEILEGGKYGTLVPVGDIQALAEAMLRALEHPFPAESLRDRAAFFSEKNCIEAYGALFDELLS